MAGRAPSYLVSRAGTVHFRFCLPVDLRPRLGRTELRMSLGTGRLREARVKALALAVVVFAFVNELRAGKMSELSSDAVYELVHKELVRILEQDRLNRIRDPWSYKFTVDLPKPDGPYDELVQIDDPDEGQMILDGLVREKRWTHMSKPVMDLLEENKADVSPWEPEFSEACYNYTQGLALALDVIRRRNDGDIEYNIKPFFSPDPIVQQAEAAAVTIDGRKLSDVIALYIQEKTVSDAWGERTRLEYPRKIATLTELMGDADISAVNHEFARTYKERLLAHVSKGKNLSPRTINNLIQAASGLFDYAERHGYVEKNVFRRLSMPEKRSARDERDMFSSDDLAVMFGPGYPGDRMKEPWPFWIPLLGLYTGARIEELSQLHVDDVKRIGGLLVIDINDNAEDKRVKTATSKRIVPVHPFVDKELGFGRYVDIVRESGTVRVFQALNRVNFKYGHSVSTWFGKYVKRVGIAGAKSFHSFRHTFTTNLIHKEVPVQVVDWLTGHATQGETAGRYTKLPTDPAMLMPHVMKLDFGVDLSHLKKTRFAMIE
ncbi:site-specific integrase [Desulfovibrio sp. TomC]|uniref:site-specific integrase n=1 Tax=Desulfovibrio sp. TomC TaxID=1562888 RepID=UPI0005736171|nr:Integrase [Desulfovibrio sp. TomC]